jgi:hypothetical protein
MMATTASFLRRFCGTYDCFQGQIAPFVLLCYLNYRSLSLVPTQMLYMAGRAGRDAGRNPDVYGATNPKLAPASARRRCYRSPPGQCRESLCARRCLCCTCLGASQTVGQASVTKSRPSRAALFAMCYPQTPFKCVEIASVSLHLTQVLERLSKKIASEEPPVATPYQSSLCHGFFW